MAPRRKAAAAAAAAPPPPSDSQPNADPSIPYGAVLQPLTGLVLSLCGTFDVSDYTDRALRQVADDLGATVSERVTKDVTHVVATRHDVVYNRTKVANANTKGLPVIRAAWLLECDRLQKLVEYDDHLWTSVVEAEEKLMAARVAYLKANVAKSAAADAKKRPIAVANPQSDDSADQEPVSKKSKAANGANGANGTNGASNGKVDAAAKDDEDEEMDDVKDEDNDDEAAINEQIEKEQIAEGQIIKRKDAVIPVDLHCPLSNINVYICPDIGMIYDASLNQTNASHNNNKFYIVQLLVNPNTNKFNTWTRWGRVGETGASALLGNGTLADAVKQFEKKFKDKSGLRWEDRANDPKPGKYAFIERSYEPDSDSESVDDGPAKDTSVVKKEEPEPECTLEEPVRNLMEMIFNQAFFQATMAELNYDANKLPLGKLSKATILRGFEQLKSLSALFDDPSLAQSKYTTDLPSATEHLSNTYYSLIPHDFGRYRPPVIRDQGTLKREVELLESLSDMKIAADLMKADRKAADTVHHLDRKFQGLNLEQMTPLKKTTKEFKTLEKYLAGTVGTTHGYQYTVIDIFRIERHGERTRFSNSSYANMASDRRLLWHGSRCTNFGGILSQGLRIAPPEAPVSGYMFGKGIYLADMSSKSAGYCCSGMSNGEGLLLLCDAELGDPMQELKTAAYDAPETAKKGGMYSSKGLGRMAPQKWMDAGSVHKDLKGVTMPDPSVAAKDTDIDGSHLYYNEYICYDVDQVQLRYLFRVKMN